MKRFGIVLSMLFVGCMLYAQEVIDIAGKQMVSIEPIKKYEQFIPKRVSSSQGFVLELTVKPKNGEERILGRIAHFTGYEKLCKDGKYYFSIDNYISENGKPDELFVYNMKKGVIQKLIDAKVFAVSDDGKYICYCEPYQTEINKNHEVSFWYIYEVKTKKSKIIIDKKQKNNWDVYPPVYDGSIKSFVFDIGYDGVVKENLVFNPSKLDF